MILRKFFIIFGIIALISFQIHLVYGHGLGVDESEIIEINGQFLKMKTKVNPDVLEYDVDELELTISLIDTDSEKKISNVSYNLKILDGQGNLILKTQVYTPRDELAINIIPDQTIPNFNFIGEDYGQGWMTSENNELQILGPIFSRGGLYQIVANVLSINDQDIIQNKENEFLTLVTIGEFIPFKISYDDSNYNLTFATYFDAIREFEFDEGKLTVTADMPFNWDKEFIEFIPFVHAEYYIPKSLTIFETREIITTVNDREFSTMIDRSQDEEIVVHYLIHTKKLLQMADQMTGQDANRIIFGMKSGEPREALPRTDDIHQDKEGKMIKMSTKNDWKLYFWWEPEGTLEPNKEITFNIMFHDPVTDVMVKDITYDFEVYQDGNLIESRPESHTFSGHELQDFTFSKEGTVTVEIKNINGVDTGNNFEFSVESLLMNSYTNQILIPKWVRTNAGWWADSLISDNDFASGIEYMIKNGIIHIPVSEKSTTQKIEIPNWVRNNAKWWSENQITDNDFASGIQYLIKIGIISV